MDTPRTEKRKGVLRLDDYYMAVAFLSGMRSKDPKTQVGACIVNKDKRIVGIGYNGMPNGCSDDELPWNKDDANKMNLNSKYPYVCHAELNAIVNSYAADVKDCTIYISLYPCNECAKLIIQSGIKKVVYASDKNKDTPAFDASKRILDMANVYTRKFEPLDPTIPINFSSIDSGPKKCSSWLAKGIEPIKLQLASASKKFNISSFPTGERSAEGMPQGFGSPLQWKGLRNQSILKRYYDDPFFGPM